MPTLTLHLLGAPYAEHNGAAVDFSRHKCLALLAYLAVTRAGQGRDTVTALLWPELGQARARAALRRTLVALTQTVGKGWLTFADDRVAIYPQPGLWVDVWRFHGLLAGVADHAHSPFDLCDDCLAALAEAADLHRNDFMAGFSLRDGLEFDTWQAYQAESLRRELAGALETLTCAYAGRRQFDLAIACGRRRLVSDSLHEGAHRWLMRIYTWAGDRGAALRQADEYARLLATETGAVPQPETIELAAAIRAGRSPEWSGEPGADDAGHLPLSSARTGLPLRHTPFFGREAELVHIAACLADPTCRLLTIVGPGGAGKTRLAVKAVASQGKRYANGVHFVSLAAVAHAGFIADAILRALDAPVQGGPQAQLRLLDFLHDKQMLLVLDNFEHLAEGADLLLALLDAAPGIKLLVTSRERLNLRDEWLAPIEGLEVPPAAGFPEDGSLPGEPPVQTTPLTWAELERYSAIQLFLHGVQRLRAGFRPAAADAPIVVRICQLLDGLPLGIELAAAWTRTLPFAAILDGIEHNLDFLAASLRDLPARQHSLRAVFDHSWRLLTARQRSLLRQTAVFRGGFTAAAAGAVAGATLADLAELVDRSWLRVAADSRFDLHEPSRHYCEEKLDADHARESGESAGQVRSRHSAHYGLFLQGEEHDLNVRREVLAEIEHEWGNVQAAWQWAVEHAAVGTIRQMVAALLFVAETKGRYHAAIQLYDTAIRPLRARVEDALSDGQAGESALLLARILYSQGQLYRHLGWLGPARRCVDENLRLLETVESGAQRDEDALLTDFLLAWILYLEGEFAAALAQFTELATYLTHTTANLWPYAGQAGVQFWAGHAAFGLALTAWRSGDYERSRQHFICCLTLRDAMGEQRFKAYNLRAYARLLLTVGDVAEAQHVAQESLRLSQSFRDRIFAGFADITLGHLDLAAGRHGPARERFAAGLAIARETGNFQLLQEALLGLGAVELALGQAVAAQRRYEESLDALRQLGIERSFYRATAYAGLGQAALACGDAAQAEAHFQAALDVPGCSAWDAERATAGLAQIYID